MSGSLVRKLCGCGKLNHIKYVGLDGKYRYSSSCGPCRYEARKHKKDYCKECGSNNNLEIDHIDGNRSNNKPSNLQTLCKKCHINKTIKEKDYLAK